MLEVKGDQQNILQGVIILYLIGICVIILHTLYTNITPITFDVSDVIHKKQEKLQRWDKNPMSLNNPQHCPSTFLYKNSQMIVIEHLQEHKFDFSISRIFPAIRVHWLQKRVKCNSAVSLVLLYRKNLIPPSCSVASPRQVSEDYR